MSLFCIAEDYVSTPKTVTILPGQTRACTTIEVVEDTIDRENPEQFCVNITSDNPVIRYQPPECQIMITIIDNIRKHYDDDDDDDKCF